MLLALIVTAAIALTVPGMVLAIRALPWVARKVEAGIKPWACDICSCFWLTGALVGAVAVGLQQLWPLLTAGPAYTVAMIVLSFMERPITVPPLLAPSEPEGLAEKLEGKS